MDSVPNVMKTVHPNLPKARHSFIFITRKGRLYFGWAPIGFQVSASLYMYFGGTLSVAGFQVHLPLFGVSVLGRPSHHPC